MKTTKIINVIKAESGTPKTKKKLGYHTTRDGVKNTLLTLYLG